MHSTANIIWLGVALQQQPALTVVGEWEGCRETDRVISTPTTARFLHDHDDVIKWKHFPRYWPFVRGIHRSPVNSPHKGQWRGALLFSLICALNKRLSKQSWGWWFDTPSRSLWRHYNDHISSTILYNVVWPVETNPNLSITRDKKNMPVDGLVLLEARTSRDIVATTLTSCIQG